MSVMTLSYESFGNVHKTLCSPSIREGNHGVNVHYCLDVRKTGNTLTDTDNLLKAIDEFVRGCYIYNCFAYGLRYKEKCQPMEKDVSMIMSKGSVVTKPQLYLTLKCIAYNSHIKEYMLTQDYESSPYRAEFEKWWRHICNLRNILAESIAEEIAEKEGCKWG